MKLNLSGKARVIPSNSPEVKPIIEAATREADVEIDEQEREIESEQRRQDTASIDVPEIKFKSKLSQLIDDNFPFDESQLAAIEGMESQQYACMTGAAGTGKTTSLKKLVDKLQSGITTVDMNQYFAKAKEKSKADGKEFHDADDYEVTERFVPAICLCSFTGRASQMIKKNFPRDWHSNIMTIHRMLAYMPEWYEEWDEENQEIRNKMRFVPTYTAEFKMPWDIIIIDEAGMLGVDLWHNVLAALKPGARVYMVGDINQLPPTHGKSVFGFALANWPSWELTHIHRQTGVNNSIVDNAWAVLQGRTPKGDDPKNRDWKFLMMELPGDVGKASVHLRAWLKKIRGPLYDPIRDTVITPINAYDPTSGYALGQDPLNRQLALMFNENTEENPRYIIDAGRDRKYFAVGDKVMATRNDYDAGITNGMTGIITGIARHGNYTGNTLRFDTVDNVNRYLEDETADYEEINFSLDDIASQLESDEEEKDKPKEKERDRGPASHIVTIKFGEGDSAFEIAFSTLAEVASLMTAYVVTCHKMQGGEAHTIIVIVHNAHKRMLFREWLYTAMTRASQRCVVLYTRQGLATALAKQNIKGSNLAQKVEVFNALQTKGLAGAAVNVRLPDAISLSRSLVEAKTMLMQKREESSDMLNALAMSDDASVEEYRDEPDCSTCMDEGELSIRIGEPPYFRMIPCPECSPTPPKAESPINLKVTIKVVQGSPKAETPASKPPTPIDGGVLKAESYDEERERVRQEGMARIDKTMRLPGRDPGFVLVGPPRVVPYQGVTGVRYQKLLPPPVADAPVGIAPAVHSVTAPPKPRGFSLNLAGRK